MKDLRGIGIQVSKLDQVGSDERGTKTILNFVKKLDPKEPPQPNKSGKLINLDCAVISQNIKFNEAPSDVN